MKTNACIKDALSKSDKKKTEGKNRLNELYMRKLIKVVHFLAAHNLPVKELYPKLVSFLANDIKEPVVKQYLAACKKSEVNIDKIKKDYQSEVLTYQEHDLYALMVQMWWAVKKQGFNKDIDVKLLSPYM